jgi:hypothetical protein
MVAAANPFPVTLNTNKTMSDAHRYRRRRRFISTMHVADAPTLVH